MNQCDLIFNMIEKWPALVSLELTEEIISRKNNKVVFTQHDGRPSRVKHTFILIGVRKSQGYRFLLQNTWRDKPFIEVSGQYLHKCNACISFYEQNFPNVTTLISSASES
jgi:hypothetical protein